MCLKMPVRALFCAVLTFTCLSTYAAPLLNGIAIHQELGNEQFIGALYSESLSDNSQVLLDSSASKRMELKIITTEGLTTRRFSRMWIEGMAINNSNAQLTAQANNMVKFDGLFKGRLHPNDHIVFALNEGQGVSLSVNNVLLGTIEDDSFFKMLLSTWIGRVPLSSTYRESLLKMGDVPTDLRSRFEAITPKAGRASEIAHWNAPEPEPIAIQEKPIAQDPKPKPTAQEKLTAEIAPPKIELPALVAPIEKPTFSEPEPAVAVLATLETQEPEEIEDEEDAQPTLTAESLLARQFYVSDILKEIRSSVRYPRRAMERSQTGGVRIAVTINRSGEIINMAWLEESRYDLLNQEAWEAVKRAAPFGPLPASLAESSFEFTAPISFEMR